MAGWGSEVGAVKHWSNCSVYAVSRRQVYVWRRELGIENGGRRVYDDLSEYRCKIRRNAKRLGYGSAEMAIVDLRVGGCTVVETARRLGVSEKTVRRHYPPGFAGSVFVKTERYWQSRRRPGGNWSNV